MEYSFYIQNFWTTCACPEKQRVPWIHYLNVFFYYSGFLSNLRLPWKTERALKFFAILNIFFIILEFWVTCACPENRVTLEFFTVLNILFTFRIFEQLALALKNRVALEFFTVLKYILWFRIFEELAVALKTEFALKIFKPGGGGRPPPTPRLVRLCWKGLLYLESERIENSCLDGYEARKTISALVLFLVAPYTNGRFSSRDGQKVFSRGQQWEISLYQLRI